jgi:hypothetical protein
MVVRKALWEDPFAVDGSGMNAELDGANASYFDHGAHYRGATSSQATMAIETPQATGPAGLDWWITPDFDDDPDWRPGGVEPLSAELVTSATDDHIAVSIAVTDRAQARLAAPQDEIQTSSLTFDEISEQYPGIVWPANWWLL